MQRIRAGTVTILTFGLCAASLAYAGEPAPFPDFTFKRIKVPPAGVTKRITVQIEPASMVRKPTTITLAALPRELDFSWFWQEISPSITVDGPSRMQAATSLLSRPGGPASLLAPPLQGLSDLAKSYWRELMLSTAGTRVSPAFALAVLAVESRGLSRAESRKGALGLMQLMPETARRFDVSDPSDPRQNISGGAAYLDWLMREFQNDPVMVLASYNAGENVVRRHEGVPPFPETRAYVPRVLAAWLVARNLCATPPELVSDGCVFAVGETNR